MCAISLGLVADRCVCEIASLQARSFAKRRPSSKMFGNLQASQQGMFGAVQPQAQTPFVGGAVGDKLEAIRKSYAPARQPGAAPGLVYLAKKAAGAVDNDECRFKAVFYDESVRVPGQALPQQTRLGQQVDDRNPDPENLVEKRIYGIDDLVQRFDSDEKKAQQYEELIRRSLNVIRTLEKYDVDLKRRFEEKQQKQAELEHRMIKLLGEVEKIKCQDQPLEFEEYKFREGAEEMVHQLRERHARLTELINWQSQHDLVRDEYADNLSDADLEVIYSAMAKQHEGLQHVTDILERDERHIHIIQQRLDGFTEQRRGW